MPRSTTYFNRELRHQVAGHALKLREVSRSWWQRLRYRKALARLVEEHPELVADIGLTVADAEVEAHMDFWKSKDVPTLRPW